MQKRRKTMTEKQRVVLTVNGQAHALKIDARETLAETLRGTLGLKGTKKSCDSGACGACTVILDGKAVLSCMKLTLDCEGSEITTIEGLKGPVNNGLHPIQQAFLENNGAQCGFCTPGMIMAAKALLDENPAPSPDEVKWALAGNICRCGNYRRIAESVLAAAGKIRGEG
jgi:carbon-monoxide dehydrogenase small subunit